MSHNSRLFTQEILLLSELRGLKQAASGPYSEPEDTGQQTDTQGLF